MPIGKPRSLKPGEKRISKCPNCDGIGTDMENMEDCKDCDGTGKIEVVGIKPRPNYLP